MYESIHYFTYLCTCNGKKAGMGEEIESERGTDLKMTEWKR